ncbi:hypothetical protein AOQ84DRAFT_297419 [Glonium stellatum]|uniref:Uncharacterized protein n=1 Tax=Glonium stellatum TaxID=574774 RepID=A0A8E2JQX6_9PEZI|nr:hypothetical protein AOQ84DRAFT_297419 [Glonium stellatum]
MSIGIYGSVGTTVLHTMVTKKALRVIYFDGQSASLTTTGSLDSQMAALGLSVPINPSYNHVYNETLRAHQLCDLAHELRIDGVVRMNAGFEVMLCDYAVSGVQEIITSNITVPENQQRENDPSLPHDPHRTPPLGYGNLFAEQNSWEWLRSGAWGYGESGHAGGSTLERRVGLDLCGMITFYDPQLRSLSGSHHGGVSHYNTYQNGWGLRRGHRLLNIGKSDAKRVQKWLKYTTTSMNALDSERSPCSGIDWQALTEVIVDHHISRAGEIHRTLKQKDNSSDDTSAILVKVHELSHAILCPYFQYPSIANLPLSYIMNQTITQCAAAYTEHIDLDSLGRFELLIKESIHKIMFRLCTTEWKLFEWSGTHNTNLFDIVEASGEIRSSKSKIDLTEEIERFRIETTSIMQWLGWEKWQDCEEECKWKELCYIPMWPVIYAPGKHQGGIYGGSALSAEEMCDFWRSKCLSRDDFDRGGGRDREPKHRFPDVPYDGSETASIR